MANVYVESSKIEVFPSGFRGTGFTKAKLTTEENLTLLGNTLSSNSLNNCFHIVKGDTTIIGINGYVFRVKTLDLPDSRYCYIKLRSLSGSQPLPYGAVLSNIHTSSNTTLDTFNEGGSTYYFRGLCFTDDMENVPNDGYVDFEITTYTRLLSSEILDATSLLPISKHITTEKISGIDVPQNTSGKIFSLASNLENGEAVLSLKTKGASYESLITYLMTTFSLTRQQAIAVLQQIGITGDITNTNNGLGATVLGAFNTNNAIASFISGFGNTVGTAGDLNKGSGSISFGVSNNIQGENSITIGDSNLINRANGSGAIGNANTVQSQNDQITLTNAFTLGNHLFNKYSYSTVIGRYNNNSDPASGEPSKLFQVGNGTADNARSNAFEVLDNGSSKIFGDLIIDKYINGAHIGVINFGTYSFLSSQDGDMSIAAMDSINIYTSVNNVTINSTIIPKNKKLAYVTAVTDNTMTLEFIND